MAGGEPLVNTPVENLRNTAFTFHTGEQDSGFLRNRLTQITGQALDSIQALYPDGLHPHHTLARHSPPQPLAAPCHLGKLRDGRPLPRRLPQPLGRRPQQP